MSFSLALFEFAKTAIIVVLLNISLSNLARANDVASECPSVWSDYVESVEEIIIRPLGKKFPLLFVSREGNVYDCLGRIADKNFLKWASASEMRVPFDRTSMLAIDSTTWPVNVCSDGASFRNGEMVYVAIYLPTQLNILETTSCKRKILGASKRILQDYQKK